MRTALFLLTGLSGLAIVGFAVARLVRLTRGSVLFRLPLVAQQTFRLEEAGTVVMNAEAPIASAAFRGNQAGPPPAFRGLAYAIHRTDDGQELPLGGVLGVGNVTGFSTTRVPLARLHVERPGEFRLSVRNLVTSPDTERCAFLFARAQGLALPLTIVGLVLGGVLFIAGTVFTILDLSGAL